MLASNRLYSILIQESTSRPKTYFDWNFNFAKTKIDDLFERNSRGLGFPPKRNVPEISSISKTFHRWTAPFTMLQKLSKCEVKACNVWHYVKSHFSKFKRSKNVVFGNVRGSEFWFLVNLSNFQVPNLPKFKVQRL